MNLYTRHIRPEQIAHDILMAEIQKLLADNKLPVEEKAIFDYYCQHYQSTYQDVRFVCKDRK